MSPFAIDHARTLTESAVGTGPDLSQVFDVEVRPHLGTLSRRALRLTGSPEAADDLVQDTLERGYRKLALFQAGTDLRAWLLSIMRNVWISRHRRHSSEPGLVSLDALDEVAVHHRARSDAASVSVVEQLVAESLGEAAILTVIHALPPGYRDVVMLADVEGVPYRLVAERLQIPVGSVCSRLSRARQRLRRALNEHVYDAQRAAVRSSVMAQSRPGHRQGVGVPCA